MKVGSQDENDLALPHAGELYIEGKQTTATGSNCWTLVCTVQMDEGLAHERSCEKNNGNNNNT